MTEYDEVHHASNEVARLQQEIADLYESMDYEDVDVDEVELDDLLEELDEELIALKE